MKVLHVNSNYLTSRLHENLIDELVANNVENTIFMPIKKQLKKDFLYESKHNVLYPITFKNRDRFFFKYKQNKIFNKLIDHVNPIDYDVVHAHSLFTDGYVALSLYKKYNIPYIVTLRSSTDIEYFFKLTNKLLIKFIYKLFLMLKITFLKLNLKKLFFISPQYS